MTRSGENLAPFIVAGVMAVLAAAAPAQSPTTSSDETRLIGLWGTTRSFGPEIRGELTLAQAGDGLRASIAGTSAHSELRHGEVSFALAANQGSFWGQLSASGIRIRGIWVQPAGIVTSVAWATPVDLRLVTKGVWRGTVVPLDESVTLFVDIRKDSDGVMRAVLRNPDGFFANAKFALAIEGTHLKFRSVDNGATLLEGDYDTKHDRLLLPVPDGLPIPELRTTLELTRRSRDQAIGYYPRTPAEPHYVYQPPSPDGDGWQTSSLSAVGLDEARISSLVQKIIDTDPRPQTAPLVQGLLIARHGKLVLEEYFYGFDRNRPHDMRSAGKTLASVLAGIAIDHGAKFGPETPVYSLFPGYASFANPDPRKARMTVEHLMTMTSGFACDENGNENAPGNEDKMQSQTAQPDWDKFMLDVPLAAAPGDVFAYCSGAVNLIGGIVHNTTGKWIPAFFDHSIAQPLQMGLYHMNLTPTNEGYLGGGLHLRPRDEIKLGQIYLDGGVWQGKRIVSRHWVDVSTAPHPMNAHGTDGYDWHLNEIHYGNRTVREYEASGNGGQFLMVLPELDLVVLFSGGNYQNYGVWRHFRDELLPQYILSAVK
jgi:CubicO group peptidase (beta-lactamase class C family)